MSDSGVVIEKKKRRRGGGRAEATSVETYDTHDTQEADNVESVAIPVSMDVDQNDQNGGATPFKIVKACESLIQLTEAKQEQEVVKEKKSQESKLKREITSFLKKEGKGTEIVVHGYRFFLETKEPKVNPIKEEIVVNFLLDNLPQLQQMKTRKDILEFVKQMFSDETRGKKDGASSLKVEHILIPPADSGNKSSSSNSE